MANALSGIPEVQNEGKFLKFAEGEKRTLKFVGMSMITADERAVQNGYADANGQQIQIEFTDVASGSQKFYTCKDGSSKVVKALKALPDLKEGDVVVITKTSQWEFEAKLGEQTVAPSVKDEQGKDIPF